MRNKNGKPCFSLVVATLGRSDELQRLFDSLRAQTYMNFHVVIVDQNPDDRVERVIASAGQGLDIRHVRSDRGLSRGRNVGLKLADGDIVAFPDDDCWYPPDLLEGVARILAADPSLGGLTGQCADEYGKQVARFRHHGGELDRFSVWTGAVSTSIFLRKEVVKRVGMFDETLGAGAPGPYQSGEETDYLLRALESGHRLLYVPGVVVYHRSGGREEKSLAVLRCHGAGMGRVLRKHGCPFWFALYLISRSLGGFLLSSVRLDLAHARVHLSISAGRISGWLASD